MPRPLPVLPRGPGRRVKRVRREKILLACPRIAPDWELAALQVLMKPKEITKGAIRHRSAEQRWTAELQKRVDAVRDAVLDRLGHCFQTRFPETGDYHLVIEVDTAYFEEAKAFAVLLTRWLPGTWLVLERLFVRDGVFYRRQRGYRMNLVPAADVHLTRPIRSAVRDLLDSRTCKLSP